VTIKAPKKHKNSTKFHQRLNHFEIHFRDFCGDFFFAQLILDLVLSMVLVL